MYVKKEFEDFKSQCDIVSVVSHYVVLEKAGSSYRGLCPFHDEKTPSFYVNPQKGFFHCFGCGASGDVIEFVKKIENLSFQEAVQKVAELSGIESPLFSLNDESSKYFTLMENVAKSYQKILFSKKEALSYLIQKRGFSEEEIKRFEIGYAPINSTVISSSALKMKIENEYLMKYGLVGRNANGRIYEFFNDRIMFPIRNQSGKIVAFGGRIIGDGEPKYLNSSENNYFSKSKVLYLFDRAKKKIKEANFAIICEGYMDAIAFHKNGFENACAILGVNLTHDHLKMIKGLTKNMLLILDSDRAGITAMERFGSTLAGEDMNVKVLTFEDVKDPDEFFRVHKSGEFNGFAKNANEYWDFYVRTALGDTSDKFKAIRRFSESIKWMNSPALKTSIIQKAAKLLMMNEKDIMYELRYPDDLSNNRTIHNVKIEQMDFEDHLIYIMFLNENLKIKVLEKIEPLYLSGFAKKIFDLVSKGESSPQEILKVLPKEEGERFFRIITSDLKIDDFDETLRVAADKIKEREIRSDLSKLEKELILTEDPQKRMVMKKKMISLYAILKGKRGGSNGRE
uniref:DNA primase n=1 Tax=Mesoaciditoga lauensis TaxID=1495039 RepID=A0A7V3RED2_9BACT